MPVSLVKLSLVSFWMSTICGLPTMRTLSDFASPPPPPPPPPPAPAQPDKASPATAGRANAIAIRLLDLILTATSGCDAERLLVVPIGSVLDCAGMCWSAEVLVLVRLGPLAVRAR